MLGFLAPVVSMRQPGPSSSPPRCGTTAATVMISFIVALALLTPVGWVRSEPEYAARVGVVSRLGPRAEDLDLIGRLDAQGTKEPAGFHAFFARQDPYDAIPPGLHVDAASGALVGIPSMPGTYTIAIGVSDGEAHSVTGPAFKVKVLPAS